MAKILIIEDERDAGSMTGYFNLLDQHGFQIACSHKQAFDKFVVYVPDIILIDIMEETG